MFASDNTTFVEHLPLVGPSVGNDIRTRSFFANDTWRMNGSLTFNAGLRYDHNTSEDQADTPVWLRVGACDQLSSFPGQMNYPRPPVGAVSASLHQHFCF